MQGYITSGSHPSSPPRGRQQGCLPHCLPLEDPLQAPPSRAASDWSPPLVSVISGRCHSSSLDTLGACIRSSGGEKIVKASTLVLSQAGGVCAAGVRAGREYRKYSEFSGRATASSKISFPWSEPAPELSTFDIKSPPCAFFFLVLLLLPYPPGVLALTPFVRPILEHPTRRHPRQTSRACRCPRHAPACCSHCPIGRTPTPGAASRPETGPPRRPPPSPSPPPQRRCRRDGGSPFLLVRRGCLLLL